MKTFITQSNLETQKVAFKLAQKYSAESCRALLGNRLGDKNERMRCFLVKVRTLYCKNPEDF